MLGEEHVKLVIKQVLQAVAYLHARGSYIILLFELIINAYTITYCNIILYSNNNSNHNIAYCNVGSRTATSSRRTSCTGAPAGTRRTGGRTRCSTRAHLECVFDSTSSRHATTYLHSNRFSKSGWGLARLRSQVKLIDLGLCCQWTRGSL